MGIRSLVLWLVLLAIVSGNATVLAEEKITEANLQGTWVTIVDDHYVATILLPDGKMTVLSRDKEGGKVAIGTWKLIEDADIPFLSFTISEAKGKQPAPYVTSATKRGKQ